MRVGDYVINYLNGKLCSVVLVTPRWNSGDTGPVLVGNIVLLQDLSDTIFYSVYEWEISELPNSPK